MTGVQTCALPIFNQHSWQEKPLDSFGKCIGKHEVWICNMIGETSTKTLIKNSERTLSTSGWKFSLQNQGSLAGDFSPELKHENKERCIIIL